MSSVEAGSASRRPWVTNDPELIKYIDQLIWPLFSPLEKEISFPELQSKPSEIKSALIFNVLESNGLYGLAAYRYRENLKKLLPQNFINFLENGRVRTKNFLEELYFIFEPKAGLEFIVTGSALTRPLYDFMASGAANPRFLQSISLWVPTLESRDHLREVFNKVKYQELQSEDGYKFLKINGDIKYNISMRGTLWTKSKSWSTDIEHIFWDRSEVVSGKKRVPDRSDLFLMAIRHFSIDTVLANGSSLFDLVLLLTKYADTIDWLRIHQIINMFPRPDWFWSAILSLKVVQAKAGQTFVFPDWVNEGLQNYTDGFWAEFVPTRLSWANPECRLVDFSRAKAKLVEGK